MCSDIPSCCQPAVLHISIVYNDEKEGLLQGFRYFLIPRIKLGPWHPGFNSLRLYHHLSLADFQNYQGFRWAMDPSNPAILCGGEE